MFEILSQIIEEGDLFFLGDPLHEVLYFMAQHVQFEHLFQFTATFLGQILQTSVQLVNLGLSYSYLVTVKQGIQNISNILSWDKLV